MRFLNIAYALPSLKVTNQAIIDQLLEKSRQHLSLEDLKALEHRVRRFFKLSGTETRYHRNNGEKAIDFAVRAGRKALEKSELAPGDIDLLIYTGVGRGWVEPATANLFQSELGLTRATCFDVLDACASWIRGLSIAKSFLDQAVYKTVMILNCEFNFREYCRPNLEMTRLEDLENAFSAFTIGEAATATIVTADGDPGESDFSFRTWGDKHELCKVLLPNAGDFSSNGLNGVRPMSFFTAPAELLSFTIRKLVDHFREAVAIAGRTHDLIVGHAVSRSATSKVAQLLRLDVGRIFETHPRFGNTVSASLPLALAVAEEEGRLQRGMQVLLMMGSAGVTTALGSFRY